MFTLTRRRVVAGAAALAVVGAGVTAAFVVPALAAPSSPVTAVSPAAASPSPSTSPKSKHQGAGVGVLALGRQLAAETAKQTGLSRKQLLADLRSGETLDHIAGSKAQTVLADVLAADQSKLSAAVQAGKITAAQGSSRMARLRSEAGAIMGMDLAPFLPGNPAATARPAASTAT
jgi:hypothetical protein